MTDPSFEQSTWEPLVLWQPHDGTRHGYKPNLYPDGAELNALCGHPIEIRRGLDETTWLAETCPTCMRLAWERVNPDLPWPWEGDTGALNAPQDRHSGDETNRPDPDHPEGEQ